MKPRLPIRILVVLFLILFLSLHLITKMPCAYAGPTWPSSWIEIDWDRNENGAIDDWRDVKYAYYQYDSTYLYLKLECYDVPGKEWPLKKEGRYKWFIDLDGNMYYSGGNVYDAEYLLFVEDTDYNGAGEMYLLFDANDDNCFGEYEPWPPANYSNYKITDPNIGGWRIVTSTNQIEMYIKWTSIGNPTSYWLFWSTDQQNPNLDQAPTTDRIDEGTRIGVHNVAAVSQTPTPTVVKQGEHVTIQVVVENKGTLKESFNVTCYFNNTVIGTQRVTNLGAGRQATLTFDWDTTGLPAGNYNIKAWADSNAEICETDECDNWCTSPAIVTIQSDLVHDLAAISQVPNRWNATQGMIVNINVTVSNLGDFTETFNVTCFYDNNPISYQTVTNLAKKTTTSTIFAWNTAGVQPGTYYIRAMADSSRVITESNECNNNCTTLQTVTIYSPDQMGKLFVDKVKTAVISGEDPPVVNLPTVYELTIIVTNIGGSDVSNIVVNETISSDVTFVSLGTPSQGSITALPPPKIVWSVGTLSHGANATLKFRIRITPPSLGRKYLNHKEDLVAKGKDIVGNTVSDIGDTDTTVTPIIRDVAAISQVPTSTIVCQGDTVTIHVTVKNFGNVSETFDVACYYDGNQIDVIRVYNLGAGSQTTIPFAWDTTGIAPGTYSISAKADSSNEIAETNETNNTCTSPTTIKIVIHDIAIISQSPSPTNVVQGETVTIEVVVKNEGTEPETFTVSCYINETLLETKTVTNLAPNTMLTLNFIWDTTGANVGKYYINTEASTVPGEKDTSDNACKSVNTVTVKWLQYQITVTATPAGAIGGTFKVTYTKNGTTYTSVLKTTTWIELVDAGTTVTVSEPQDIINVSPGTRCKFDHYEPSSNVVMDQARTITLAYKTQYEVSFTQTGSAVAPTVSYNTETDPTETVPFTVWVKAGTQITYTYQNIVPGAAGVRYFLTDGNPPSPQTVNSPLTIIGNYKTQYLLTVLTAPAGLSPQPTRNPAGEAGPPNGWWYDTTISVTLTAQTVTGYTFNNWDVGGTSQGNGVNPIQVNMSAPKTATAHYTQVTALSVSINPLFDTIYLGESVDFTSTLSGGTPPYKYQWYVNSAQVSGANASSWKFTPPATGLYYVYLTVKDANNNLVQSKTARITVMSVSVGGYSISFTKQTPIFQTAIYTMLIALFGIALGLTKRKRK